MLAVEEACKETEPRHHHDDNNGKYYIHWGGPLRYINSSPGLEPGQVSWQWREGKGRVSGC